MTFPESKLAHRYLDDLKGIEIGGSAHNAFGLKTWNVCNEYMRWYFNLHQTEQCGRVARIDVTAEGDELPFRDSALDFVLTSHVLEHFYDPIFTLKEWHRVVRNGGYIFAIVPHVDRTFDKGQTRTTLAELVERHTYHTRRKHENDGGHFVFWTTEDIVELVNYLGWPIKEVQDRDDKVGNGFSIVIGVEK